MLQHFFYAKLSKRFFLNVSTLSICAVGILLQQSVFAGRVVLKDGLQIHRALLHNATEKHGHMCDCYNPFIDNVKIFNITSTGFSMSWDCDAPSTYQVKCGTTTKKFYPPALPTIGYKFYTVNVTGLFPNTTYNCNPASRCVSESECGGKTHPYRLTQRRPVKQSNWTVKTLPGGTTDIVSPNPSSYADAAIISKPQVTGLTAKEASIRWTTRTPSTSFIEYGLTGAYGSRSDVNELFERDHYIQLFSLPLGKTFHARAGSTDSEGKTVYSPDFTFTTPASEVRVTNLSSICNEPNPCFERTVIAYDLYQPVKRVTIDVLTLSGQIVANLEAPKSTLQPGRNKVMWDVRDNSGKRLPEGLYIYQVKFYSLDDQVQTAKSTLMVRK